MIKSTVKTPLFDDELISVVLDDELLSVVSTNTYESSPFSSAAFVLGPSTPSTAKPANFWNSLIADLVPVPLIPKYFYLAISRLVNAFSKVEKKV